jgi:hypothetical protein
MEVDPLLSGTPSEHPPPLGPEAESEGMSMNVTNVFCIGICENVKG